MPINSIQFRAEIGQFNNAFQRTFLKTGFCFSKLITSLRSLSEECLHFKNIVFHLLSVFIVLLFLPVIFLFTLSHSSLYNFYNNISIFYIIIYICLRFIFNLFWINMVNHKGILKFLVQYCFFFQIFTFIPFIRLALIVSGDIETNPGPENCNKNISFCHWNINGIAANNFVKISLLEAYNTLHDFDLICISETFLDSDYPVDDSRLNLQGYTMIRSDHQSNTKRGGGSVFITKSIYLF